ncbi:MAG: hypothetical protein IKN54_02265 [Lachnospiraceae bacterium]|nr:hypothetical protein [Lachnospiraceae bacterium]
MALVRMDTTRTETYWIKDKWFIDITISPDGEAHVIEAWLYHNDCGIKILMFGESWDDTEKHTIQDNPANISDYDDFLDMVECQIDEYIDIYTEEHMI